MRPQCSRSLNTIRQLSNEAPGLDGVGFDFLKALPHAAMKDLVEMYHQIEETAMVPNQWLVALIATLPKTAEIERPIIALVATMYRLWCRLGNNYTKDGRTSLKKNTRGKEQFQAQNAYRLHCAGLLSLSAAMPSRRRSSQYSWTCPISTTASTCRS